jgi:hypothetical protein
MSTAPHERDDVFLSRSWFVVNKYVRKVVDIFVLVLMSGESYPFQSIGHEMKGRRSRA